MDLKRARGRISAVARRYVAATARMTFICPPLSERGLADGRIGPRLIGLSRILLPFRFPFPKGILHFARTTVSPHPCSPLALPELGLGAGYTLGPNITPRAARPSARLAGFLALAYRHKATTQTAFSFHSASQGSLRPAVLARLPSSRRFPQFASGTLLHRHLPSPLSLTHQEVGSPREVGEEPLISSASSGCGLGRSRGEALLALLKPPIAHRIGMGDEGSALRLNDLGNQCHRNSSRKVEPYRPMALGPGGRGIFVSCARSVPDMRLKCRYPSVVDRGGVLKYDS
jgi:hypothetical protein